MWRRGWTIGLLGVLLAAPAHAADDRDPLTRARQLYNEARFEAAIVAADQSRSTPQRAAVADLIAARAYLERFRATASPDDLESARERLRRIDPQRFSVRERSELIVGLGEALFFGGQYGAAAELFRGVITREGDLDVVDREKVLDWWASALDRQAGPRSELERQAVYQRIRDRMREELGQHPASGVAAYWIAAASRGAGDLTGAWASAEAAWVRAPLAPDHGAALRADLDRLMTHAIIPDRAKALAQPADVLLATWQEFKARWEKP
jgi:hypothetical protein